MKEKILKPPMIEKIEENLEKKQLQVENLQSNVSLNQSEQNNNFEAITNNGIISGVGHILKTFLSYNNYPEITWQLSRPASYTIAQESVNQTANTNETITEEKEPMTIVNSTSSEEKISKNIIEEPNQTQPLTQNNYDIYNDNTNYTAPQTRPLQKSYPITSKKVGSNKYNVPPAKDESDKQVYPIVKQPVSQVENKVGSFQEQLDEIVDDKDEKRLLSTHPDNYMDAGKQAFRQEDFQTALRFFKKLLSKEPNNNEIRGYCTRILYKGKKQSFAENEARSILQSDPSNIQSNFTLAEIFYDKKDFPKVEEHLKNIKEDSIKSDFYISYKLGVINFTKKNYKKSIDLFQSALSNIPANKGVSERNVYYNLGLAQFNLNKPAEALVSFNKALSIDPNHSDSKLQISLIQQENKNYSESIIQLQDVISKNPNNMEALYLIGKAYENLKDYSSAKNYYSKALALNSKNSDISIALNRVKKQLKK